MFFGPSKAEARLEASKIESKEFMNEFGIPTSHSQVVASVSEIQSVLGQFQPPYVLKADGLAAGKGVAICQTEEELLKKAKEYFEDQIFGLAGTKALLEEFQEGWELSFLILTNGRDYIPLPLSQDHKRLGEGDVGPNTGGMGVVGPLKIDLELEACLHKQILKPSVEGLKSRNWDYRGILYVGVMVTSDGPKVIEYNVRFGDPEAQVILPLLDGDWGEVFRAVARGELPSVKWKSLYGACVVMAAEGYPESPVKGVEIQGEVFWESPLSYFLHAGTKFLPQDAEWALSGVKTSESRAKTARAKIARAKIARVKTKSAETAEKIESVERNQTGQWVTNGGRVLNSVALGSSMEEALERAYKQASQVTWSGVQMRRDIGYRLKNR